MDRLLVVSATLAFAFFWRQITLLALEQCTWWRDRSSRFRAVAQYYTPLYAMLGAVLLWDIVEMGQLLEAHPWLDPDTFAHSSGMPEKYRDCPAWLRWLSLGTPVAAAGSFAIGAYHTKRHASAIRKFGGGLLSTSVQRDRTVQVIAFPAVFSLMSFGAVVELWSLLTGYGPTEVQLPLRQPGGPLFRTLGGLSWKEKEGFVIQRYTALFAVAAVYEAYALLVFVWLSLDELEMNMRLTAAEAARAAIQRERLHSLDSAASEAGPPSSRLQVPSVPLSEVDVPEHQMMVVKVLRSLTMQGVIWFVLTCFLDAVFDLYVVHYAQVHDYDLPPWSEGGEMCFYGMGFLASSAAITNVVSVEGSLHDYFGDFRCAPKFLSCKIMVSIAFLQSMAVSVISGLPSLQRKVLYSTLICYEVLALSCFHIYAWPEDEPWLENTERGRKQARARWKYAVSTMSIGQKMLAWLHRARERLAAKRLKQWRRVPEEEPVAATRSAPPAPEPQRRELRQLRPPPVPVAPLLPHSPSGVPMWYSPKSGSSSPSTVGLQLRSFSSRDLTPHYLLAPSPAAAASRSGPPGRMPPSPTSLQDLSPQYLLAPSPAVAASRSGPPGRMPPSPTSLQVPVMAPAMHHGAMSPSYMTRVQSAGPSLGTMAVAPALQQIIVHSRPNEAMEKL